MFVCWNLTSPVTCHLSPFSLPPFYTASAVIKVLGEFGDAAAGGLVIDSVKIYMWQKPKLKGSQFLFVQFKKEALQLEVSIPLQ